VGKSGRVINALEARGFLNLRRGADKAALEDFNGALAKNPAAYWSLYGRSIIERRMGDALKADDDRAKAFQSNPKIAKSAAKFNFEAPAN
jgi:tetratricopeptide (TPR) repeat protein